MPAEPPVAARLVAGYRSGELSPVEVAQAQLARIAELDPVLNAMAWVDPDAVRATAGQSQRRWRAGQERGPLDGVPVTIKDSIVMAGTPWRHGVAANRDLPDSTHDAPPAARLREAGAVVLGKTTMPDMGMLAAGVSSLYGITRNPWDLATSTGGSSSGAGASLAAGIGCAAVGSDIAGSVRLPAAQCGLVALKPTQGAVPHLPPSIMRSAGPMARTVDEVELLFDVLTGADPRDRWSLPTPRPVPRRPDVVGLRIGVLSAIGHGPRATADVLAVVTKSARLLEAGGALVEPLAPPFTADPYPDLDRVFQVRAITELAAIAPDRRAEVLPAVAAWAAGADGLDATRYLAALAAVERAQAQLVEALRGCDYVLSPVLPVPAFPAGDVGLDPARPLAHTAFTAWFNQTGQPAATLCMGFVGSAPVGVQLVGRRFDDRGVLDVVRWLEGHRELTPSWPTRPRGQAGQSGRVAPSVLPPARPDPS